MIEIVISFILYYAIFATGVHIGRKKGMKDERAECLKWAMRLNSKTLEIWQDEQSKNKLDGV